MNRNSRINAFVKALVDNNLTLALGESVTCGLAAHMLSTCKGTSMMFRGSLVCYHESVKKELLKIPEKTILKYSAESKVVTELITKKLPRFIKADIYASVTGLASGGGSETKAKPVGTVFFSILYKGRIYNYKKLFRGTPLEIRIRACLALYDLIYKSVIKKK
jgi:nicotinamide-nucleotide amidase